MCIRLFIGFLCYLVFHFVVFGLVWEHEQAISYKIAFICRAHKTSRMWMNFYTEFGPSIVLHSSFLSFNAQNNLLWIVYLRFCFFFRFIIIWYICLVLPFCCASELAHTLLIALKSLCYCAAKADIWSNRIPGFNVSICTHELVNCDLSCICVSNNIPVLENEIWQRLDVQMKSLSSSNFVVKKSSRKK